MAKDGLSCRPWRLSTTASHRRTAIYKALSPLLSARWEGSRVGTMAVTLEYELLGGRHLVCFVH